MTTQNLQKSFVEYDKMNDADKEIILQNLYSVQGLSWAQIATITQTYPNRVRRDAKSFGIKSRTKAEAQSQAISSGRTEHPTKGKVRPESVKIKISDGVTNVWANLSSEEREARVKQSQEQWANMTDEEREKFQNAAAVAIRKAAAEGSKLEKYLCTELSKAGYHIEAHKKHLILNENLHLDLYIPKMGVAIEVDGLSHFEPIWGLKALQKNQKADSEKAGLLLGKGLVLIRIRQLKSLSASYQRNILGKLVETLKSIEKHYPEKDNRYIVLGD